jgi:predicted dienelactone hydrolase
MSLPGRFRRRRQARRPGGLGGILAAALLGGGLLAAGPARAVEEVILEFPLLELDVTVRVPELENPAQLRRGTSDLAELDRASGGRLGPKLTEVFNQPVPVQVVNIAEGSVGSPLLEQALFVLSALGTVEGGDPDLTGSQFLEALRQASAGREPSLLSLIKAIPGERVRLNLGRIRQVSEQMLRQRREAERLLAAASPEPVRPAAPAAAAPVRRQELSLPVPHRSVPLELVVIRPADGGNGRLVLVSHGLWDSPLQFEGWGQRLAAAGYTVVLPRHPGSDDQQQQQLLRGTLPPPAPEELLQRPKDLSAVIDAAAADRLGVGRLDSERVVVIGHSWGATTALQLAGLAPSASELQRRCPDLKDPDRNLSWTLQCSWLEAADLAGIPDRRVVAVAAVSPPLALLFPPGTGRALHSRVLLVSGTRDWVVPPDPEAVVPMARGGGALGHRLVMAQGGDHFNLRPGDSTDGGVLGNLVLAWAEGAFAAGEAARPGEGAPNLLTTPGWGHELIPLVDVTGRLPTPAD